MEQAAPAVRDLARHLLALEASDSERGADEILAASRVFEKLRVHLSKLIGLAGFQALLSRALALAKMEAEWLETVRVLPDATLAGFSEAARQQSLSAAGEGGAALLAQLLGLLVTFIGEALTLRLVQEMWPEARWNNRDLDAEEARHG